MKKIIVLFVVAFFGFFSVPFFPVFAQTINFTRDLSVGSSGADVALLQAFLESQGTLVIPSGLAKGYFGLLTKNALIAYQKSVGINSIGYFGPITRKKVNLVTKNNDVAPVVTSLSPASGQTGATVIINGNNFSNTSNGNTVLFDGVNAGAAQIINDTELSFVIPYYEPISCLEPQYPLGYTGVIMVAGCDIVPRLSVGAHTIAIETAHGISATSTFTITGLSQNPPVSKSIESISPSYGTVGTQVTITGSGFTTTENSVVFGNAVTIYDLPSSDGTHLVFTVPQNAGSQGCLRSVPGNCVSTPTIPGLYTVQVENATGLISTKGIEFTVESN